MVELPDSASKTDGFTNVGGHVGSFDCFVFWSPEVPALVSWLTKFRMGMSKLVAGIRNFSDPRRVYYCAARRGSHK